jgi:two-component system, LuxR family, sensor kinase FixL
MTPTRPASSRLALIGGALGVAVGYYAACQVGLSLRLPGATPSILWPPNAILTSALVLSPPKRWPLLLLAALPIHLFVEHSTGWPLPLILSLFVTNCIEAVVAAGGIWLFSDSPRDFDTFPRLTAFMVSAVIAGPLLSSFADAAAVTIFHGEPYWTVFARRTFSNALAELTFVPAVVGLIGALPRWRENRWTSRTTEALVLAIGFSVVWVSGLHSELANLPALRVLTTQAPLALQLPFLLWAGVRFGPVGAGVTLLATSLLSGWSLVHGVGPFATLDPNTTVPALIISLIVVATTLMYVSTLVDERRHTQHALASRLEFEELLSRLSGAFVQLPSDQMDAALDKWLGQIGAVLRVDLLALFVATDDACAFRATYWWSGRRLGPPPEILVARDFPWILDMLFERRVLNLPNLDALPENAATDRRSLESLGLNAALAMPLAGKDTFLGVLACGSFVERRWEDELKANLRLVSEVLASALARKQTEDALRTSELMKSAILQSLQTGVAVVDRLGSVVALNEAWRAVARESGAMDVAVGGNLLMSCEAAARLGEPLARALAPGIAAVLSGSQPEFSLDHRSDVGPAPQWWTLQVLPLGSSEGGAVIAQSDVTDVRRAELEAQRSRQELAHVARVSTVGELTASIAHQLNQPLSAIMTNAQAARRVLDSPNPDFAKLHAILVDIVKDDRRASDIIKRLRELLRRGELAMTRVNLTKVIREVADLVIGDAIVRGVTVSLDVDHHPVFVRGDSVQLQQVVLNLLQNAMDAVDDQPLGARLVTVRCRAIDGEAVRVSMHDTGPGLPAGSEDLVFEPFYTTKPTGMGMGLSIVRSIVEAHGGSIHATNHEDQGAVFEVLLPVDAGQAS